MATKERSDVSILRSHIGYRMRIVSNAVSYSFAKKLAAFEVTVAEWVILRQMYPSDEALSQSAIADLTGLTRGAVSKLIDRLLKKGLLNRAESSKDRRYQDIKLTASALKLVPKLARVADENDESFFSILSKAERKTLMDILIKIAEVHELNANPIE